MSFYFNIHNPLLSAPTHLTSLTCPPATYTVLHSSCIKTFVVPQRCGDVRQSSLSFYVLFSLSFSVELLLKVLHLFCFPTAPCTISLIAFVMLSSNYCYIYLLFNSIEHPLRTGTISWWSWGSCFCHNTQHIIVLLNNGWRNLCKLVDKRAGELFKLVILRKHI